MFFKTPTVTDTSWVFSLSQTDSLSFRTTTEAKMKNSHKDSGIIALTLEGCYLWLHSCGAVTV